MMSILQDVKDKYQLEHQNLRSQNNIKHPEKTLQNPVVDWPFLIKFEQSVTISGSVSMQTYILH